MVRRLLSICLLFAITSGPGFSRDSPQAADFVRDKTVVVWVAPANLTQRGGSALTIEDRRDHFDAVVFGELAPGKWMAGSDFYSRTLRDQSSVPVEDSLTTIQVTVIHRGRDVQIYRNGQVISHYTVDTQQVFGPDSLVLFGKRHRHAGDNAHFAGIIEDARIYDRALTADEISELKPKKPSAIAPWAWWTFDDPSGADRTRRFPIAQLTGGAKIENGKLVLDGKDATLICRTGKEPPFVPETPAMPDPIPATWLTYHLAHPGPCVGMPGDPNCAFYWKGQYHLHYIYNNKDGFSFAHVSSTDLVHWKWHPTTLTPPTTEHGMFSGTGFFTKEGRPAIIYHGQGSGRNQIQVALDDELETWTKPWPVEPKLLRGQDASLIAHWDPDCWLEGDTYYALSGGSPGSGKPPTLFRSKDLQSWDYLGLFLDHDMPDVQKDEDISCPNFFRIGNKRMLLCISHNKGCRYYLGAWKNEKFVPEVHQRMNWHGWDFFAPESLLTPDGRRVMWAWCNIGDGLPLQTAIQSLPRELNLPRDGVLRIKPLRQLEMLRMDERRTSNVQVETGKPKLLEGIGGDAMELKVTVRPARATQFGVKIYCDHNGANGLPIVVEPAAKNLSIGEMRVPFELKPGEDLALRIFLDKNMVEVFANDRQAAVAAHKYAPEDTHVSLVAEGGTAIARDVHAWKMRSIYK